MRRPPRGNAEFAMFGLPALLRANLTVSARMMALAAPERAELMVRIVQRALA